MEKIKIKIEDERRILVSFRLSKEVISKLKELAKKHETSQAKVIEHLVKRAS